MSHVDPFNEVAEKLKRIDELVRDLDDALKPTAVSALTHAAGLSASRDEPGARDETSGNGQVAAFETLADFFHSASPAGESDKALVAAYYLSEQTDSHEFIAGDINAALRDLGEDINNIGRAMSRNVSAKRMMQAGISSGKRVYKLTHAGRTAVEGMMRSGQR